MRKIDLEAERKFQNKRTLDSGVRKNQSKFYWAVAIPTDEHNKRIFEEINGKSVLEIGCSNGGDATLYSQYATSYVGVDISDEAIKSAKSVNMENAEFLCVDGHRIPRNDGEFDCIIVNSLLHHLDLSVSFKEISRLLGKDGCLIFREPLGTNPIFQIYRMLTPSARTVDERPFSFSDLRLMNSYFVINDMRWFGFSSLISAFIRNSSLRTFLTRVDDFLGVSPLKYFFWQFCGFAKKR